MQSHGDVQAASRPPTTPPRHRPDLGELFRDSLWLGVVGFGGGLSVLANIHSLIVSRRRWLTEREFANTVTVSQMLPGGAAANALAYIGLRFGGISGALVGYGGFVAPGFCAVLGLAWVYVRFGTSPSIDVVLGGFNAAVVGIVASITLKMTRSAVNRLWQMGVAVVAILFSTIGNAPPGEIVAGAIAIGLSADLGQKRARLASVRRRRRADVEPPVALPESGETLPPRSEPPPAGSPRRRAGDPTLLSVAPIALVAAGIGVHAAGIDAELLRLFLTFFRTGLGAYGGGFAIVPHLKQVMQARQWLTDRQFADAVAFGKLTPGPVLLLATFIGYVRHGLFGAVAATIGIFAGPFLLIALAGTWVDRLRSRRTVRAALRGLTPAVLGLMVAAVLALGTSLDSTEMAIAAGVGLTLVRFDLNPALMLVLGGVARFGLRMAGI